MLIYVIAIAEIVKGKKLTDKELSTQLKERLDKIPELNVPSISGADSMLYVIYYL